MMGPETTAYRSLHRVPPHTANDLKYTLTIPACIHEQRCRPLSSEAMNNTFHLLLLSTLGVDVLLLPVLLL